MSCCVSWCTLNSSTPGNNDRHFADDIFKCIFTNESFCISIQISLKIVPKGSVHNKPVLVHVVAWRRTGLYVGQCLSRSPTQICSTDAYLRQKSMPLICSDNGLSPVRHYLNQYWLILKWTLRDKLQWNLYQTTAEWILKKVTSKLWSFCLGPNALIK